MKAINRFRSNEELFQAVRNLIAKLDAEGHIEAGATLRDGFRCLNGLTDGSALFLEAIEKVREADAAQLTAEDRTALEEIRSAVRTAVYRR